MTDAKWLKGKGGTEFLQFSGGRITRERFPLNGYLYRTTIITGADASTKQHYSGSSYDAALEAYREVIAKVTGAA